MDIALHDVIGTAGVIITILSYFLLQISRLKVEEITYSASNAIGSLMILFSLYFESNFSAALMEIIWCCISLYGVVRILMKRKKIQEG